jgi:hypothetical protein
LGALIIPPFFAGGYSKIIALTGLFRLLQLICRCLPLIYNCCNTSIAPPIIQTLGTGYPRYQTLSKFHYALICNCCNTIIAPSIIQTLGTDFQWYQALSKFHYALVAIVVIPLLPLPLYKH